MSTAAIAPVSTEMVDRRVLGGFRFVDSLTGKTVTDSLVVTSTALTIKPNRSGIWIVFNAPGLTALTNDFPAAETWPSEQVFLIQVRDAAGQYLPRQASLKLPATLTPNTDTASIFNPQSITLYAGPGAAVGANWATVYVSAQHTGTTQGLPYALVKIMQSSDNALLATGITDLRGEALLSVPGLGIRASSNGGGAVMETTTAVSVQVFFDTTVLTQPAGWLPDPDQMLSNTGGPSVKSATQSAQLSAGLSQSISFAMSF